MGNVLFVLRELQRTIKCIWESQYRFLMICVLLWIYRIDFWPADAGGLAKTVQVVSLAGMFYYVIRKKANILKLALTKTNAPVVSCMLLYMFAVASTLWSVMPAFTFILALQNIVLMIVLVYIFSECQSFVAIERTFLFILLSFILFEGVFSRLFIYHSLFYHHLPCGTTSALVFSYCIGEIYSKRLNCPNRKRLLKGTATIALIFLVISTSAGANASAVLGFCVATLLSGKVLFTLLIGFFALLLFINQNMIADLILLIMPGKDMATIENKTGRTDMWEVMLFFANQRPFLGWGFATIERVGSQSRLMIEVPDAHSNFVGFYGSLGYVGSFISIIHYVISLLFVYLMRIRVGMVGLGAAISSAIMNGYSYGFLSGKACTITVAYFAAIILLFFYSCNMPYYGKRISK